MQIRRGTSVQNQLLQATSLINMGMGELFRSFKISVGVTPLRYVESRCVQHLCTILITTLEPALLLGLAGGFSDQAYLSQLLRRTIGMRRSAWRLAMTARYVAPDAPREHRCQ